MDIKVRGLTKIFGHLPALHDIHLDIGSGELLGLLGPSGSGKSTFLRILAGLDYPDHGEIFFGEENASAKSVQERRIGFVFQNYALFQHMSVADNIAYGLRVRPYRQRPSRRQIAQRVGELLDLVQLAGLGDRYPHQLSGGQRQRIALARAFAVEPRVLLLDEPFGALDAKVRHDLRRWLREIHDRTGHTTIFVTHDQSEALELSDRIVLLQKGRIEQMGTPDAIYDTPASPFVFGFMGDANRLDVHIEQSRPYLHTYPLALPLDPAERRLLAECPHACLLFRPQHAQVCSPTTPHAIPAHVENIRRVGGWWRVDMRLAGETVVEIDVPENKKLQRGELVHMRISKYRIYPSRER